MGSEMCIRDSAPDCPLLRRRRRLGLLAPLALAASLPVLGPQACTGSGASEDGLNPFGIDSGTVGARDVGEQPGGALPARRREVG